MNIVLVQKNSELMENIGSFVKKGDEIRLVTKDSQFVQKLFIKVRVIMNEYDCLKWGW